MHIPKDQVDFFTCLRIVVPHPGTTRDYETRAIR